MTAGIALVLYALVLVPSMVVVWRRPVLALYAFLVGLAVYNLSIALIYRAGVHGAALDLIQAWKEILLATAALRLLRDAWRARSLPFRWRPVDYLALAFAALVVLYAVVPQSVLGGEASPKGALEGARHDLTPVLAYFVGRSVPFGQRDLTRLGWALAGAASVVAAFGLVDLYAVPIEWWRDSGAVGFFRHQGYDYHGPGGLPENFVFNSSAGVFRRLTSLFLGPLGTAYLLATALLAAAAGGPFRRRPVLSSCLAALWTAALLLTLSRSTMVALAGAFVVLAIVLPRRWPIAAGAACVAALFALNAAFPHVAPHTHFFPADIAYQEQQAKLHGGLPENNGLLSSGEPSFRSHLHLLKEGVTTVAHHPQGYGLGNAGVTAVRFDAPLKAGESTYTELGVEAGALGAIAFIAWSLVLLVELARTARRTAGGTRAWAAAFVTASFALVLALAIQTDVLGVLWLAFGIWWLAGALVDADPGDPQQTAASGLPGSRAESHAFRRDSQRAPST